MKSNKKLKAVHCYQYVRFAGKNENFFTVKPGMEDIEITLLDDNIVSIKSSKDNVLVFSTNIAYAIPMTETNATQKMENRGALLENAPATPKR